MLKAKNLNKIILILIKAFLIVYALCFKLSDLPVWYDGVRKKVYYDAVIKAVIDYNLTTLLVYILAIIVLIDYDRRNISRTSLQYFLALLLSAFILIGRAFAETSGLKCYLGGVFYLCRFLPALIGIIVLMDLMISYTAFGYNKLAESNYYNEKVANYLGEKSIRNVSMLLILLWLPILILSFPGTLCYDSLTQINMVLGVTEYTTHHPLFHTLVLGGIVKMSGLIAGSYAPGLFLYSLAQVIGLAIALASTVHRLYERNVSLVYRLVLVCIYCLAPMYSNMATTIVKDAPYLIAMIWYILLLEELLNDGLTNCNCSLCIKLIISQLLVCLFRNNGVYVIVITGIFSLLLLKRVGNLKNTLFLLLVMTIIPLTLYKGISAGMESAVNAKKGSIAEMLSLPLQQTARYLVVYGDDISDFERDSIEAVLQDINLVAESYNSDLADPVKKLFIEDSGKEELINYARAWMIGLKKHPEAYVNAFLAHVYGWFYPGVQNSVRYEVKDDVFTNAGLFGCTNYYMEDFYIFIDSLLPFALLDNVGIYVWLLFILTGILITRKDVRLFLLAPLFVSLLICMVSPCFYDHPRYAFPIMFTLPFIIGVTSKADDNNEREAYAG